jgi:hypothetical protein
LLSSEGKKHIERKPVYYINWHEYESLQSRVVKSACLLDVRRSGWEKEIDLSQLDMTREGKGILDQLWGNHEEGIKSLRVMDAEHGFKTRYIHENPEDLNRFWKFQVLWRLPPPPRLWTFD